MGREHEARPGEGREPTLLEREAEIAALEAAATTTAAGDGRVVPIEAAAGMGKTRLVAEAARLAHAKDLRVVSVRAAELERDVPFVLVDRLLGPLVRGAPVMERDALLGGRAAPAAQLLGDAQPALGGDEATLRHALLSALANLCERDPLALLVDDAHWGDAQSLRLLALAAERIGDLNLLLVVAARPNEPGSDAGPLRRIAAAAAATRLAPSPLSAAAVRSLIAERSSAPDDSFTEACREATGGNPLLVRELLVALGEEGVAPRADAVGWVREAGPEPVARSLQLTFDRLPGVTREVARAVAVLDRAADAATVAAVAGCDGETAATAAGDLEEADVLARSGSVQFAHPILQRAVLVDIPPSDRAMMHRRAARATPADDHDRVAAHLMSATTTGDEWAVDQLQRAAGRALGRGAPADAARYLRRALAEPPPDGRRPALLAEHGRAAATAGLPDAHDALELAVAAAAEDERAALLLDLGRTLYARGEFAHAADAFQRGLDSGDADPDLHAELNASWLGAARWDRELAGEVNSRVAKLLERPQNSRTTSERSLLAELGGALCYRCQPGTRDRAVQLALAAWSDGALVDEAGADAPAIPAVTAALLSSDEEQRLVEVCDAMLADATRRGSIMAFATACYLREGAWERLGRLSDAIADSEQALAARAEGWDAYTPAVQMVFSTVLIHAGDMARAADVLAPDPEAEAKWAGTPFEAALLVARANLALARRDYARAVKLALAAGRIAEAMEVFNPDPLPWRRHAALGLAGLDRRDEAREVIDVAVDRLRAYPAVRALGVALRVRGVIEPDAAAALPFLDEAAALLAPTTAVLDRAYAEVALGGALRAAGDRDQARDRLRTGLDLADRCGADPLAREAQDALVQLGARPRRASLTGRAALTPSEQRVAGLAARGLTNREIAESLFVTMKTVTYHLGNTYRKLGTSAREDLAGLLGD